MIEYRVYCDGCGEQIASSRLSSRAARAEAQLNHGANHGPDGDQCLACRKARTTLRAEHYIKAADAAHGRGTRG